MRCAFCAPVIIAVLLVPVRAHADIYRRDDGQVIPGSEGIALRPGVDLSGWNSTDHNLRWGNFSKYPNAGVMNLTGAKFSGSWLDHANFFRTNLANADLSGA